MSLIPGPSGTKVQLIDGVQTDTISALTAGNGVQLEGRTSGTAIPTTCVGGIVFNAIGTNNTLTSATTSDIVGLSASLTAGSYRVDFGASAISLVGTRSSAGYLLAEVILFVGVTSVRTIQAAISAITTDAVGFRFPACAAHVVDLAVPTTLKVQHNVALSNYTGINSTIITPFMIITRIA